MLVYFFELNANFIDRSRPGNLIPGVYQRRELPFHHLTDGLFKSIDGIGLVAVSYTHLDVYKRQRYTRWRKGRMAADHPEIVLHGLARKGNRSLGFYCIRRS